MTKKNKKVKNKWTPDELTAKIRGEIALFFGYPFIGLMAGCGSGMLLGGILNGVCHLACKGGTCV